MIELTDRQPVVDVQPAEYIRLLGFPRGWTLQDRALELAEWAGDWFRRHGRPWIYARTSNSLAIRDSAVVIDDVEFASPRLGKMLADAEAEAVVCAGVSAGPELEAEANRLWQDGRPDEYFFLEVYGSAVVEHLVTMTGARLCAWAESEHLAVLPHYSPGYPDWPIAEQPRLLDVLRTARHETLPGAIDAMESGMLRPKKSLLAVFGLTRAVDRVRRLTDLVPCANCSYLTCQYRRAPYRRTRVNGVPEIPMATDEAAAVPSPPPAPLTPDATYATSRKALARWADERLTLSTRPDGSIAARFRYDGTTCTNMGQPIAFDYHVVIAPSDGGYVIRDQRCAPAPGDEGHMRMCSYLSDAAGLMRAIECEAPLTGHPLEDVLTWPRPARSAGCYCEPESRQHKWGLVLETIHFALSRGMDR